MDNSAASESTEIADEASNTQHTSGIAPLPSTSMERNFVQDIENQNMQGVAVEVEPPIVIGTNFNQQQHTVQDIENPKLEGVAGEAPTLIGTNWGEFDGAPPNFVQQQHTIQDNENQNWEAASASTKTAPKPGVAAAPSVIVQLPNMIQDNGSQTLEDIQERASTHSSKANLSTGEGTGSPSDPFERMYRAALDGDWAEAEKLLKEDPTLAYQYRRGYTPLHVAVALKHDKFARKLIERMEASKLELEDSNDLTACVYAAASGRKDIAQVMIKKNKKLVENSLELIFLAILSGKNEVVSLFLDQTEVDRLREKEWLELLQNAIGCKMNDVALKILKKDGSLATKSNDQGTALHVLARQDISAASTGKTAIIFKSIFGTTLKGLQGQGEMQPDFRFLAEKLLDIIKEMNEPSALGLLNNPPILHDAAKVGNMELIVMLTRAYPDLIWQTDDKERSLFNIAIEYREANVFSFIQRFGALNISCMFQINENDGNSLLHLAANLGPRKNAIPALQMQSELAWFKVVEAMLPQLIEEKNKNNKKPRDLFVEEHEKLLRESKEWMKSAADSCMLVATIILTVVYAAAFTVPGGNNEATGLPILVKSNWLTCFFIFEALALFSATLCIITFWSITCSGFEEDQFLDILPYQLRLGFTALFGSLIGAISAFLSAYHMVLVEGKAWLVKSILLLIYVILVLAICGRFKELWDKTKLPKSLPRVMSKGPYSRRDKTDTDEGKGKKKSDLDTATKKSKTDTDEGKKKSEEE